MKPFSQTDGVVSLKSSTEDTYLTENGGDGVPINTAALNASTLANQASLPNVFPSPVKAQMTNVGKLIGTPSKKTVKKDTKISPDFSLLAEQNFVAFSALLGTLAKRIQFPLNNILYCMATIQEQLNNTEENSSKAYTKKVFKHLHDLDYQFNNLSFLGNSLTEQKQESINISNIFSMVKTSVKSEIQDSHSILLINMPTQDIVFNCRIISLVTALKNLIHNAIQAAERNARITLSVKIEAPKTVDFIISDDGPGMSEDLITQIFQPFFTTYPYNLGLGLAVVNSVVKAHNGEVWVKSEKDKGTHFGLRFPQEK